MADTPKPKKPLSSLNLGSSFNSITESTNPPSISSMPTTSSDNSKHSKKTNNSDRASNSLREVSSLLLPHTFAAESQAMLRRLQHTEQTAPETETEDLKNAIREALPSTESIATETVQKMYTDLQAQQEKLSRHIKDAETSANQQGGTTKHSIARTSNALIDRYNSYRQSDYMGAMGARIELTSWRDKVQSTLTAIIKTQDELKGILLQIHTERNQSLKDANLSVLNRVKAINRNISQYIKTLQTWQQYDQTSSQKPLPAAVTVLKNTQDQLNRTDRTTLLESLTIEDTLTAIQSNTKDISTIIAQPGVISKTAENEKNALLDLLNQEQPNSTSRSPTKAAAPRQLSRKLKLNGLLARPTSSMSSRESMDDSKLPHLVKRSNPHK